MRISKTVSMFLMIALMSAAVYGQAWLFQATDYTTNANHGEWKNNINTVEGSPIDSDFYTSFIESKNAYIALSTNIKNQLTGSSAITVEGWIYATNIPSDQLTAFVTKISSDYYGVSIATMNNKLRIGGRSLNTDAFQQALVDMNTNEWIHVAGIFDYFNDKIYVFTNGTLAVESNVVFGSSTYQSGLIIAKPAIGASVEVNGTASLFWPGYISDLRVWNIARTPEQIYQNYTNRLTGTEEGLVGYWKLNEHGAEDLYVSPNGDDWNSGLSWFESVSNLQAVVQSRTKTNMNYRIYVDRGEWQMTNTPMYVQANTTIKGLNPQTVINVSSNSVNYPSLNDYYNIYSNSWHKDGYLNIYQRTNDSDRTIIRAVVTNRAIVVLGTNVTIDSITVYGGSNTVNNTNGYGMGIFPSTATIITNCTVIGGFGYSGGGIYSGGSLFNNLVISNNALGVGGGLYRGTVRDSIIAYNSSTGFGGGSYFSVFYDSLVVSNISRGGGGGSYQGSVSNTVVYGNRGIGNGVEGGGLNSTRSYGCLITSNSLTGGGNNDGGGISGADTYNSTIQYNTSAGGRGGGISGGTIFDSLIYSNSSAEGGGIYTAWATNCVISNNTSGAAGGIYGGVSFNCDIIYNYSTTNGGGVCGAAGTVLSNCYIAYNVAAGNGGAFYSTTLKVYNSLIENNVAVNGSVFASGNFYAYGCVMRGNTSTAYVITTSSFGDQPLYLFNCNIMDNKIASHTGTLIYCDSNSSGKVANNIFSRNTSSLIYAEFAEHNWWWEPDFLSDATYKLAENSDCIDRGENSVVDWDTDYYGFGRLSGTYVDLGVAEWQTDDIAYKLSPKKKRMLIWFEKEFENEK